MLVVLIVLLVVLVPIPAGRWSVRAVRRWTGAWRAAAIVPLAVVLLAVGRPIRAYLDDPRDAHSDVLIDILQGFFLCVLASLLALVVALLHRKLGPRVPGSPEPRGKRRR